MDIRNKEGYTIEEMEKRRAISRKGGTDGRRNDVKMKEACVGQ